MTNWWIRCSAALAALLLLGCGNTDPGKSNDTDGDAGDPDPEGDYYPMAVGDFWRYLETSEPDDGNLEATAELTYEVTGTTTDSVNDGAEQEVFVIDNMVNVTADLLEDQEKRIQHISDDGVRSERVRHFVYEYDPFEEALSTVTKERWYDPGFLRFDRTQLQLNVSWEETLTRYSDTKDGSPVEEVSRTYSFTVLAVDEPVQVPAGDFDCIKIQRFSPSDEDDETKTYWFAKGVGKVKEVDKDSTEELIEFEIN